MAFSITRPTTYIIWHESCFKPITNERRAEHFVNNITWMGSRVTKNFRGTLAGVGLVLLLASGSSIAADILCDVDAPAGKNYMIADSSQVSACLDAGEGNIGNGPQDDFLGGAAGAGYSEVADTGDNANFSFTANGDGTWSVDSSVWDDFATLAIGFKFGTGNTPDEWFVYQLVQDVVTGTFSFVDVIAPGNGTGTERLSHAVLYGITGDDDDDTDVPEPGSLALLGLGLIVLGLGRRRLVR